MSSEKSYGDEIFKKLRAEGEREWLEKVYVNPVFFDEFIEAGSCVCLYQEGAGGTAFKMKIEQVLKLERDEGKALWVPWQPIIDNSLTSGSEAANSLMNSIFDACAQQLLLFLARKPEVLTGMNQYDGAILREFIQRYLKLPRDLILEREEDIQDENKKRVLRLLADDTDFNLLCTGQTIHAVIKMLCRALSKIGIQQTYIIFDGVDAPAGERGEQFNQMLKSLFSTLSFFEEPCFSFKFILQVNSKIHLTDSPVIRSHRARVYSLSWGSDDDVSQLVEMVEKRLALAEGVEQFSLIGLTQSTECLIRWLTCYAGFLPRGWIDLIYPVYQAFVNKYERQPLNDEQLIEELQKIHPSLRVDMQTQRVFLGYGLLEYLEPGAFNILEYLYRNRDRVVSREELYYRVLKCVERVPSVDDNDYEIPSLWRGMLDTALWRLRNTLHAFEIKSGVYQDSDQYIVTCRGKGLQLVNTR